ncbi:MAG TPA: restriction endonuclease subunit S [Nodularia sp. (in: cyanobacteria)]|nr:restriction endonuclease subunit S [Nodularia sp. (in: cyanobacteria)]
MGKYQGYEKYKDSGVEWLGEIPEHWSINRLGRLTEEINDINHEMPVAVDQGIPFLSAKDLLDDGTLNFEKDIKKIAEEDFIRLSKKICPKRNDIIYSRIGACLGKARIVEVDIKFLVSYSCCVIRLRQELANPIFFKYFLDSELVLSEARLRTQGIGVPDLGLKQISKFATSVPPILEQIEIARFLDYKTKQIDDLIAKKEALIEKLDEKRTALISHAVIKGLDPSVPMKDSGIEWLGEIPEHWKRGKLNYFCQIISGGTPDRNNPDFWEGDIPWVKTGEVNYQDIYSTEEYITKEGLNSSSTTLVKPETLLMAMYGQGYTRGRVAILKIEAAFNQACLGISPLSNLNIYFLYYYLISAYKYIRDTGNESSQMNLSAGLIGKISILIPHLEAQQQIVKFLDQKTNEIDQQKAKIKEAIELLKEYRTSLITNAVTGKIDVRQVPIP